MLIKDLLLIRAPKALLEVVSRRNLARTSQKPRPEKKHFRLWAIPGDLVYEKEILAKQSIVKWHPGLNTGIDDRRSIYALRDGIMVITEEEYHPDWKHPLVREIYIGKSEEQRAPPFMRYIHVIPKKPISEFKLIDVV